MLKRITHKTTKLTSQEDNPSNYRC